MCIKQLSAMQRAVLCVHVMRAKLVAKGKHFWALFSPSLLDQYSHEKPPAAFYFVGTSVRELAKCLLGVGPGTRKWTWVSVPEEASPVWGLLWRVFLGAADAGCALPSWVSAVDIQDCPSDLLYDRCQGADHVSLVHYRLELLVWIIENPRRKCWSCILECFTLEPFVN